MTRRNYILSVKVHINLQLQIISLQNTGLEKSTSQEAPTKDAQIKSPNTSPTKIYNKLKDTLQELPLQPFIQPQIATSGDGPSDETEKQPQSNTENAQASDVTETKSKIENLTPLTNNEIEKPTPKLRSRRARPIRAKQDADMIYY